MTAEKPGGAKGVSQSDFRGRARGNLPPLELYVPEPRYRPGDVVDYSHLEIQDGNAAARAFTAAEFGNLPPDEHELLRNNLLQYCELDTQAMVDLLGALEKITD